MTAQASASRPRQNPGDETLTLQEACAFLRIPEGTLRYWRHLGAGPRSFKVGRHVRYWRADLIAKRTNGRWRARYRDEAGEEHSRHFDRKIDAQQWLDQVTSTVVTGTYADPKAGRTFRTARPSPSN